MADPVVHLLAGPNGSGRSTFFETVIGPATHLGFVNADHIAAERWPEDPAGRSYDAAALAAQRRSELLAARATFATETVFSHVSKLELVRAARAAGYLVIFHVVVVPEELAVARVANRAELGGHAVAADKVRSRYHRLWPLVADAIALADATFVYDNSTTKRAFRLIATFDHGSLVGDPDWPAWTPPELRGAAG